MKTTDELLYDLFAGLRELPAGPAPRRKVAIISIPRCGSTFFCESVANTGRFGRPMEWMNLRYVQAYARLLGIEQVNLDEYFAFVVAKTTTQNGVFSLNLHVEQYMGWKDREIDPLRLGFDNIYYVYRRDRLAQALSLAKANLSDQWSTDSRPLRGVAAEEINLSNILQALYRIRLQEEYYRVHLARHVRREFCYEDCMESDWGFRDLLADCDICHQDIERFNSGMTVQRVEGDTRKIAELISYLGQQ